MINLFKKLQNEEEVSREKIIVILISIYFIMDGLISFLYFRQTATLFQQLFRLLRIIIGIILFNLIKNYME